MTEDCGLCRQTLAEACARYGQRQPEFCHLKERFWDSQIDTEGVILELSRIMTVEQRREIAAAITEGGWLSQG